MKQQTIVSLGLAIVVVAIGGCGQTRQQSEELTSLQPGVAPVLMTPAVAATSQEVRNVAANPSAHLGRLTLSGVVGIVTPHKGFILMDTLEYQREGLACVTNAEKTKIPVVWSGAAPKVKQAVHVDGTLAKTAKGYSFTATQVRP